MTDENVFYYLPQNFEWYYVDKDDNEAKGPISLRDTGKNCL
jgi:hypothetical protein